MLKILKGDNLDLLRLQPSNSVSLIYIDPPFNTGKTQEIHGNKYTDSLSKDDYIDFLAIRLGEAKRVLKDNGSIFVHLDWRSVYGVKLALMDYIFGPDNFQNEIIWSYDYGGRSKSKYSAKHDTILWYSKTKDYIFHYDELERIPYMAPELCGPEKAEKGKTITDVWWHTIVPTNGKERVNYPTQKPLGILRRFVKVHSNPGDLCMDFFAGSGSFGEACQENGRDCILIDNNPQAIEVMKKRFAKYDGVTIGA